MPIFLLAGSRKFIFFSPKIKVSAFNTVESGNHPEQSGLSASGRPQECKKFSLLYMERKILDNSIIIIFLNRILYFNIYTHSGSLLLTLTKHPVRKRGVVSSFM